MNELSEIAKTGAIGIAIVALALVFWIVREFLNYLKKREEDHTKCLNSLREAIDRVSENSKEGNIINKKVGEIVEESHKFLLKLNGSLAKSVRNHKK